MILRELDCERESIKVMGRRNRPFLSWVVLDFKSATVPANRPGFSLFLAINEGLHPMIVQAVRFYQIDDVKLVSLAFARIARSEVEPLTQLLGCTMVKFKLKFVLKLCHLRRSVKIPALKARFEKECRVLGSLQVVILIETIIVTCV